MKNLNTLLLVAVCIALTFVPASTTLLAQEVEISTGADVVSTYVFRGIAYDGPSIQPSVELSSGGFAIGAWGSQGLIRHSKKWMHMPDIASTTDFI